jgi:hypothetical protein
MKKKVRRMKSRRSHWWKRRRESLAWFQTKRIMGKMLLKISFETVLMRLIIPKMKYFAYLV